MSLAAATSPWASVDAASSSLKEEVIRAGRGAPSWGNEAFGGDYALATAMHVRYPARLAGRGRILVAPDHHAPRAHPPIEAAKRVAEALDIWKDGMAPEEAKMKIADEIERIYTHVGMPTRLHELNIPKEDSPVLAKGDREGLQRERWRPRRRPADEECHGTARGAW